MFRRIGGVFPAALVTGVAAGEVFPGAAQRGLPSLLMPS